MSKRRPEAGQLEALLAAAEQGLLDVAAADASDVVFVREHGVAAGPFLTDLESRALDLGFCVAGFAIGVEHGFESLDDVVRGFSRHLRVEGLDERGLVALLELYARKAGRRAVERFEEAAAQVDLAGDLFVLARGFLASRSEPRNEARMIRAFFEGTDLSRAPIDRPVGALSARTAKRTLAQITRLVRALGHRGTLLVASRAGALTQLSPARRESAYTVLRELVDNADGARGLLSTRLVVSGDDALFEGTRSLRENRPLATRVLGPDDEAADARVPLPHAPVLDLAPADGAAAAEPVREPEEPSRGRPALRGIIRACAGLPPFEHLERMTVGYDDVDEVLDKLFEHADNAGSVFSLLSGAYGSGKTHLLLHVTARALGEQRPVFRLDVERLDNDLGNPQRHLRRLVERAVLPGTGLPSPLDRLATWRRSETGQKRFKKVVEEIAAGDGDAAGAARKTLRALDSDVPHAADSTLAGLDLETKPANPSYRQDAYGRLLLWLELLERLDGSAGPVLVIDEAENLYKAGTSRPERRTALRSLAFYCGGALPRATVILAVTPETLEMLREEAEDMLDEVTEQRTLLAFEDTTMLRRRLLRARPMEVARLSKAELVELARRVRELHTSARGAVRDSAWDGWVDEIVTGRPTARAVVRAAARRLELLWWTGARG